MRCVREARSFTAQWFALGLDPWLEHRIMVALTWALHRNAEFYPEVPGTPYRMANVQEFPSVPALTALYEIVNDDVVELSWVEFRTEDPTLPLKQ